MVDINGGFLRGTPVLATTGGENTPKMLRVTHATRSKTGVFYMPAFPPFLSAVLNDLNVLFGDEVNFTDQAKKTIQDSKDLESLYSDKVIKPDFKFKLQPYDHQRESFLYLIYHPRALALLDPGLGKTKIACDAIAYLGKKALVICPAFLVSNWVDEIETHYPGDVKVKAVYGNSEKKRLEALGISRKYKQVDVFTDSGEKALTKAGKPRKKRVLVEEKFSKIEADILVCGYEIATINKEQLFKNFPYEILVLDECHKCKGHTAKRTIGISELAQKCHHRWGLSGSVALGDPRDLFSQFNILSPQILNQNYWDFCRKHLVKSTWNDHIVVGYKNLDTLNRQVRKHSIRYKIDDCLDLPPRRVIKRYVDMPEEQANMVLDLLNKEDLFIDGGNVPKEHAIVSLGKLSQVTGGFMYLSTKKIGICDDCHHVLGCVEAAPPIKAYTKHCHVVQKSPLNIVKRFKVNPKLDMVGELLSEILADHTNKIIIWARFTEELDMIEGLLKDRDVGYIRITDNPAEEAKPLETDDKIKVLLGNIAMGVGFTANAANYMIYYSTSYKLEDWIQSNARNRRINQKRKQTLYTIIGRDSIDEKVIEALEKKEDVVEALLSNLSCFTCRHRRSCVVQGIRQYDKGCLLSKKIMKDTEDGEEN